MTFKKELESIRERQSVYKKIKEKVNHLTNLANSSPDKGLYNDKLYMPER